MSAHKPDVTYPIMNNFSFTQSNVLPKQTFYGVSLPSAFWQVTASSMIF